MQTMGLVVDARLPQVREDRRRGDGQLSIPTATRRSTTRWSAWRRTSTCATPLGRRPGNFGSIDGDPPAAMRYTEARLEAARRRDDGGPRQGDRRLRPELRRDHRRADRSAGDRSRTCWSTGRPASPSAWRPTSRRTTCARWSTAVIWPIESARSPTAPPTRARSCAS